MNEADRAPTEATISEKLPMEAAHLDANRSMAALTSYYEWVYDLAAPGLGARVLDAGCGIGHFVEVVRHRVDEVLAVDLGASNVAILRERFRAAPNVEVLHLDLDEHIEAMAAREVDSIVCLDVLEHIEDDTQILKSFAKIAPAGTTLFLKTPALSWLYGSVDEASGHYRRYSKKELRQLAEDAGWHVTSARYMNLAGVLPYLIKSRVLKRNANLSSTYSEQQLRRIDRLVGLVRWIDRLIFPVIGPPIGQSVVVTATAPGQADRGGASAESD